MPDELPDHTSAVRYMTANSFGREYRSVRSLAEAQAEQNFAVVFEGDYGGQIYVTCPVEKIKCSEQALERLLLDIDGLAWEIPPGCGIFFELAPIGSGIAGGMGGAQVTSDVWVHPELHELGLAPLIVDVIHGKSNQLDAPTEEELERRVQAGDAQAQYLLGHKFRHTDSARSLELLRLSADQGNLGAMSIVLQNKIPPSEKEHWLIELASRNDSDSRIDAARSQLAHAYVKGSFGTVAHEQATALFQQACDRRWSAYDAFQLGKMYRDGLGVQQNNVTALMWLLLASVFDVRQYPHWHIVIRRDTQSFVIDALTRLKALMSPSAASQAEQLGQNYFKRDLG